METHRGVRRVAFPVKRGILGMGVLSRADALDTQSANDLPFGPTIISHTISKDTDPDNVIFARTSSAPATVNCSWLSRVQRRKNALTLYSTGQALQNEAILGITASVLLDVGVAWQVAMPAKGL
jgi:hypothetical protein